MIPLYDSKLKLLSERKALQTGVPVSYGICGLKPKYLKPSGKRFILKHWKQLVKISSLHIPYLMRGVEKEKKQSLERFLFINLIIISIKYNVGFCSY